MFARWCDGRDRADDVVGHVMSTRDGFIEMAPLCRRRLRCLFIEQRHCRVFLPILIRSLCSLTDPSFRFTDVVRIRSRIRSSFFQDPSGFVNGWTGSFWDCWGRIGSLPPSSPADSISNRSRASCSDCHQMAKPTSTFTSKQIDCNRRLFPPLPPPPPPPPPLLSPSTFFWSLTAYETSCADVFDDWCVFDDAILGVEICFQPQLFSTTVQTSSTWDSSGFLTILQDSSTLTWLLNLTLS